ncbi:LLM class flavin-dependent oxidoreductase [Actinocrispum wychmicini]|uniref:Alkanesulfonate monooxygenase n=1 Tax=Actinocrispum wychmicini TaxID=1213861 RepID=A0A4R2IRF5_9PSEU|nr:LLM class flavin-dependent oxidoreductase [Actinocrispum wychmicini]TCO46628.1 alkanesulfonate monooxygenase [Actinocrispum wychmicini]
MRFHWSLSSVGDPMRRANAAATTSGLPDLSAHKEFACRAEECGIESLLVAFGFSRPDPITWAAALGAVTSTVKFLVAVRSGIMSPTYFVQQVNTLSALTDGRVCVNAVAGRAPEEQRFYGDHLPHDQRYERTDEFWTICHALWRDDGPVTFTGRYYQVEDALLRTPFVSRDRPEIYLGGSSDQAVALAVKHADCMFTLPDTPSRLASRIQPLLAGGTEVGLLVSLICRPTHDEAVAAAYRLIHVAGESATAVHESARRRTDSVGFGGMYDAAIRESHWPTPYLWTGAVPYLGAPSIALVGSPEEIVAALAQYAAIGVTQVLFMGYPDLEQMTFFGAEILPRVRLGVS